MRTGRFALAMIVAIATTAFSTSAGAQTSDEGPPVAPIVAAQSPSPETLLAGLDDLVEGGFGAAIPNGDASEAAKTVPATTGFDIATVGSGSIAPTLEFKDGRLTSSVAVDFASVDEEFTSKGTAELEMNACPSASGQVLGNLKLTIDTPFGANDPVTGRPYTTRDIDLDFLGRVDDEARLVSYKWGVVDDPGSFTTQTTVDGKVVDDEFQETERRTAVLNTFESESEDDARADGEANAVPLGHLVETALRGARGFWRNNGCLDLKVVKGKGQTVEPRTTIEIVINATSVLDDKRVDAAVEASIFAEGDKTKAKLTPRRRDSSPAKFEYTSGPNRGESHEIDFNVTSKRGVGRQHVTITNEGDLRVFGGRVGWVYDVPKCDGPFGTWKLRSKVSGNRDKNGEDLTFDIDPTTLRGELSGVRYLTEGRDEPTQEIPVEGIVIYHPDPDFPSLELRRTTGPNTDPEFLQVTNGDFCTDGTPNPDDVIDIGR